MALFFDLKRFSINEGPGLRITVFFKGCPLSCVWCHNPEGVRPSKEKMYTRQKCISCLECIEQCPRHAIRPTPAGMHTDPALCTLCGACAEACPAKAMEISGAAYGIDYIMREIEKETIFIDSSGGGVTFCGGEPLMQPSTLLSLLARCRALGVHRAVDTSLHAPGEVVDKVMEETDLFLIDLKLMDSDKHRLYCGATNELILSNLRRVAQAGVPFVVRIPLIEGVNADEDNITRSAAFLSSLPWHDKVVHLLPYHDSARSKHEKLATLYNPTLLPLSPPTEATLLRTLSIFRHHNITPLLGG